MTTLALVHGQGSVPLAKEDQRQVSCWRGFLSGADSEEDKDVNLAESSQKPTRIDRIEIGPLLLEVSPFGAV